MTTYEEQRQIEKDTHLYNIVKAKVTKKRHNFITVRDATLKKCKNLLKNGADPSKLKLSEEDFKKLPKEQKKYYHEFSKKLNKLVAKIEALQVTQLQNKNAHRASYDSGIESCGSDFECDGEHSQDDTIPLIPKPHPEQSSQEEPKRKEKNSNTKEKFKNTKEKVLKKCKEGTRRFGALIVRKKNRILLSNTNPRYDPANTKIVNDFIYINSDIETEIKDDSNCLLGAIQKKNQKQFKNHLESNADITICDEKDNNILHLIASLEKEQKHEFLDELNKKIQKEDLAQLIDNQNNDDETPLQVALIAKIEKRKHKSNKPRGGDNTLKFIIKLLELGANHNQLELSEESLKKLSEEQKEYYRCFLGKLAELVEKSELNLNQEIINRVIIKIAQIVEGGYPLHSAVRDEDKNRFGKLLESGYDITTQDADGNTVLHYAIIKLEKTVRYDFTKLIVESNKELLNIKNDKGLTPIYILLECIKKKNEDRSCADKKFEETGRYQILQLLLENGTDITTQDKKGDNILHRIAVLKGEQKVTCLSLILDLVKKEVISEDKLREAVKAKNSDKYTPIQVALINKTKKEKHNHINPKSRDNTIRFCVKLLNSGVDPEQLILPDKSWNREYYLTIKGIEKLMGKSLISDEKRTELKCNFGKKLKARDIMKYFNNALCKIVTTLVFVALAYTVISSASQGSITDATAASIIAVIGVCYLIYLNVENIYEGFGKIKAKFTAKEQVIPQDNDNIDLMQHNNSNENLEKKPENQAAQKLLDQSECVEAPNTKMSNISIMRQFVNSIGRCLGFST